MIFVGAVRMFCSFYFFPKKLSVKCCGQAKGQKNSGLLLQTTGRLAAFFCCMPSVCGIGIIYHQACLAAAVSMEHCMDA